MGTYDGGQAMAIIALTQNIGTRAFALGRATAERLNYRFLTADELITRASKIYNITPEQLVIVDERRPHFWERLKTDTERFVSFFRAVVLKEMAKDKLVIVGRSVAQIMPEEACGLRVRLVGPFKNRAAEIVAEEGLAPAVAERRVRDYDREMRARLQTLMGVDIEDPANYSVTLNTFSMPLETLAIALGSLAAEIDHTAQSDHWRKLSDAALAAEVRAALMLHPKIGHAPLEVLCARGVVQINGPGLVPPWDGLINEVVRGVEGVKSVEVVAEEQPVPVPPR
jgi:cytidylate kinase